MKKHLLKLSCIGLITVVSLGISSGDKNAGHRSLSKFSPMAGSPGIVISQIYGGGGNAGATYTNDYIELFNRGAYPVDVSTWSVQYASATGGSWQVTNLTGTIPAGGYYLVREQSNNTSVGAALPVTPDVNNNTGTDNTFNMSATAGKIALVRNQTALGTSTNLNSCPSGSTVVDFVGYGTTTDCRESTGGSATTTSNAPAPSATMSISRVNSGCQDTDLNSADFASTTPSPRNSSTAKKTCQSLPVNLLSFDGKSSSNAVNLSWVTSWEEKNEGFDVLKGLSATGLEKVGFVQGNRTTLEQSTYTFVDTDVKAGQLYYYQLRQHDTDGGSTLSKLIVVRANAGAGEIIATVYPNPNRGSFTLLAQGMETSGIRMYNAFGTELPITASKDANANTFAVEPAASLPAGMYFLKLQPTDGAKQTLKVIVH